MYIYTHTNSPFYADKNLTLHTKALPFYYSPPLPIWCFDVKCDLLKHKLDQVIDQNPVMLKVNVKGLVMAQCCFPIPTCYLLDLTSYCSSSLCLLTHWPLAASTVLVYPGCGSLPGCLCCISSHPRWMLGLIPHLLSVYSDITFSIRLTWTTLLNTVNFLFIPPANFLTCCYSFCNILCNLLCASSIVCHHHLLLQFPKYFIYWHTSKAKHTIGIQ